MGPHTVLLIFVLFIKSYGNHMGPHMVPHTVHELIFILIFSHTHYLNYLFIYIYSFRYLNIWQKSTVHGEFLSRIVV